MVIITDLSSHYFVTMLMLQGRLDSEFAATRTILTF